MQTMVCKQSIAATGANLFNSFHVSSPSTNIAQAYLLTI